MNFAKRIYIKAYYKFCNLLIEQIPCDLPSGFRNKVNLFIYFDYEREFGGHKTNICDRDISEILSKLKETQIKSTWFTVGKVFEKYPSSIKSILADGHEIGSHTYAHIAPVSTSKKFMNKDFEAFSDVSDSITDVNGFHSPNGRWSLGMLEGIKKHDFHYDVNTRLLNPYSAVVLNHKVLTGKKLLRLKTMGDDWPLFKKGVTKDTAFEYFVSLLNRISIGQLGGIGFHPWVLVSDKNVYEGFISFINHIKNQKEINIRTADDFAKEIIKHQPDLE